MERFFSSYVGFLCHLISESDIGRTGSFWTRPWISADQRRRYLEGSILGSTSCRSSWPFGVPVVSRWTQQHIQFFIVNDDCCDPDSLVLHLRNLPPFASGN